MFDLVTIGLGVALGVTAGNLVSEALRSLAVDLATRMEQRRTDALLNRVRNEWERSR